jgi:hypothetical protein
VRLPALVATTAVRASPARHLTLASAIGLLVFTALPLLASQEDARFRIDLGAGVEICEAQFRLLGEHAKDNVLPVCEVGTVLPPGVTRPVWQEVDVQQNPTILHRIEWELRYELPDPLWDFEPWLRRLHQRLENSATRPHLYRIVLALEPNEKVELYAYSSTALGCRASHFREWANYPGMHFFEYDEGRQFANRAPLLPGHLVFYRGRPYVISSGLSDRTHFWDWNVSIATFRPKEKHPFGSSFDAQWVCSIVAEDHFEAPPRRVPLRTLP